MKKISSETEKSFLNLKEFLSQLDTAAVSFSGGVDSSLLLYTASKIPELKLYAYTVKNPLITEEDIASAESFCKKFNITHKILEIDILSFDEVSANTHARCYHCKKIVLQEIINAARDDGISAVLEGSHSGDVDDYRPGLKAVKELGVLSPLKDAGFDKNKIYELSSYYKLPGAGKEPHPCLATRIPYGTAITVQLLEKAALAEKILVSFGFRQVRARIHGDVLRIEVSEEMIPDIAAPPVREKVYTALHEAGFNYITVDLQGYRTGSMNINIEENT